MANFPKAQIAEAVKFDSRNKIQVAKAGIEDAKRRIDRAKIEIKSAKSDIKTQKAIIKAAKTAAKNAKADAKAEASAHKAAKKAEKAAAKAEKDAEKASEEDAKQQSSGVAAVTDNSEPLGMFYIKGASNDSFMFTLFSTENKTLAISQIYTTIDACYNGIQSVVTNAKSAPLEDQTIKGYASLPHPKFELYVDKGGSDYRFRLKAKNGQNIVASPAFKTKEDCLVGLDAVRKNSQTKNIRKES